MQEATEDFVLQSSSVTDASFTTMMTLIPGVTYQFKITARNAVGSSMPSEVLSVLAARIPDQPTNLENVESITNAYQVGLTWSEDFYSGGS